MTIPLRNSQRLRLNLRVESLIFLSWVFFVHWKGIFIIPTFKEFGVNSIYKYASTTWLKSKTFALQYLGKKSSKLSLKPLVRKLISWSFASPFLVVAIFFDQQLLFDHKQLCIWPLGLSQHYEPRNHSKNQSLKPLWNSVNVSCAKFDMRDLWTWRRLRGSLEGELSVSNRCLCNLFVGEKKKSAFLEWTLPLKDKFIPNWQDVFFSPTKIL